MFDGSLPRRIDRILAGLILSSLLLCGCRQLPFAGARRELDANSTRLDDRPLATTGEPGGPRPVLEPDDLPPLPIAADAPPPPPRGEEAASAVPIKPETPILDEALVQVESLRTLARSEFLIGEGETTGPTSGPTRPESKAKVDVVANVGPPRPSSPSRPKPDPPRTVFAALKSAEKSEPKPLEPDRPAPPPTPRQLWRDGLSRLRSLARDRARPGEPSCDVWSLRLRLLDALAKAEGSDSGTRPPWDSVLRATTAAIAPTTENPEPNAAQIHAAVSALETQAPLEIVDLQLCRKVLGFGAFEPIAPSACKPGQPLIIYCEMAGVRATEADGRFHSKLRSKVEIVPDAGGAPAWSQVLGSAEDVCRRRRRDYFVNYRLVLPDDLAAGSYRLQLTQVDEVANHAVTATTSLVIQP